MLHFWLTLYTCISCYDSFRLFAHAGILKRAARGHLRLASSFYTVLSQILFQLCHVARVSVEDFLISDYFFIFSSGTKCLLSMDGNLQLRQQTCNDALKF